LEANLLYNVSNGETFGYMIAVYFYLTGLSAGSFIISTLGYGFGVEKYRPLGKPGVILATLLLVAAPMFLLLHVGKPLRSWHLFMWINLTSPISWGSYLLTLYPINCIIYGYFMFTGRAKLTKIFGLVGIPLALFVHGYTGFILAFGKARPLWNSSIMPLLFLVSAMVSGIALMILVAAVKDRFFSPERKVNKELVFDLAKILGWMIVFDLFLVVCEEATHLVSHQGAIDATTLLLTGKFVVPFLVIEIFVGKIIPLIVVMVPRFRTVPAVIAVSILAFVCILAMRFNVVLGGEYIPLI